MRYEPYTISYIVGHFTKILYVLFTIKSIIDIEIVIGSIPINKPFKKVFLETLLACENLKLLLKELRPATNKNIIVDISRPEELTLPP
jgi:hypothetical protein